MPPQTSSMPTSGAFGGGKGISHQQSPVDVAGKHCAVGEQRRGVNYAAASLPMLRAVPPERRKMTGECIERGSHEPQLSISNPSRKFWRQHSGGKSLQPKTESRYNRPQAGWPIGRDQGGAWLGLI